REKRYFAFETVIHGGGVGEGVGDGVGFGVGVCVGTAVVTSVVTAILTAAELFISGLLLEFVIFWPGWRCILTNCWMPSSEERSKETRYTFAQSEIISRTASILSLIMYLTHLYQLFEQRLQDNISAVIMFIS
ncbi:MAG TPA: hypothetical protein PLG61_06775, partial [Methanoregulaceae archaeon]|nr:hypothetical protein [Methanoregulaceae archaeon]